MHKIKTLYQEAMECYFMASLYLLLAIYNQEF